MSAVKRSMTVSYTRDVTDRTIQRLASGGTTVRYNYSGSSDAADFVTTTAGALVEATKQGSGSRMARTAAHVGGWFNQ